MPFTASQPCFQSHSHPYPISATSELLVSKHVMYFHTKNFIIAIILLFLKLFPLPPFPSSLSSKSYCLYFFVLAVPLARNNISSALSMASSFLLFKSQMKYHLFIGCSWPSTPKETLIQQLSHNPA